MNDSGRRNNSSDNVGLFVCDSIFGRLLPGGFKFGQLYTSLTLYIRSAGMKHSVITKKCGDNSDKPYDHADYPHDTKQNVFLIH